MRQRTRLISLFTGTRIGLTSIFTGTVALALAGAIFVGALTSLAWYAIAALLGVTCIMSLVSIFWVARIVKRGPTLALGDVDRFQSIYLATFRFLSLTALISGIGWTSIIWMLFKNPEKHWPVLSIGLFATSTFLLSWGHARRLWKKGHGAYMRRALTDEFFQNNLAQARGEGFAATLAAMPVCFFVGLYEPRIGILMLPIAALICVALVGWRFNRRDAKAAGDDGV